MPNDQIVNRGESAPATRSEVDTFLAELKNATAEHARAPDLRPRCYCEPAADVGHRLYAAGRYVP